MTPLLSLVGLGLDLVGAAMLALGLFRPTRVLTLGWSRSPPDASADWAFGSVGFVFLASGFVLQGLSSLGLGKVDAESCAILAGVAAVMGGRLIAYLLYGLVYLWRFPKACAQSSLPVSYWREPA